VSHAIVDLGLVDEEVSDLLCDAKNHTKDLQTMEEVACGVTAVALMSTRCVRGMSAAICQPLVDIMDDAIRNGGTCSECGREVGVCWVVTPL